MSASIKATRYHDISCAHRLYGHEGKCARVHGHNYRIHFTCEAVEQDSVGRVIDFAEINAKLCTWLEDNWDHRLLLWTKDNIIDNILAIDGIDVVMLPYNPTAENMAKHLVEVVGPEQLEGTKVRLTSVVVEETRKCSATCSV